MSDEISGFPIKTSVKKGHDLKEATTLRLSHALVLVVSTEKDCWKDQLDPAVSLRSHHHCQWEILPPSPSTPPLTD